MKIYPSIFIYPFLILIGFNFCFAQTEVKFNLASAALLTPNIGVEIKTAERRSIQLDVLGSFWDSFQSQPYHITQIILEHRWYNSAKSLFFGTHIGFGMFTLQKPSWPVLYDHYQDPSTYSSGADAYQSGRIAFYGLTFGYKKKISPRLGLELFVGGGLTQSRYKGYDRVDGVVVQTTPDGNGFDGSGEVTLYRGGLMLTYALKK